MNTRINIVIRLEEEFESIIEKLKPIQFQISPRGSLVWTNPFELSQQISIKPLVGGSTNYNVNIIGTSDNLAAILKRALGTFKMDIRQFHFYVYLDGYSMKECLKKAQKQWLEVNPRMFDCHLTNEIRDLYCLVMDDKIVFHTRSVRLIEQVNKVLEQCQELSKVFVETVPYDLFTFEELTTIGG